MAHVTPRKPIASKVRAGGLGGATGILVVWLLSLFSIEVPAEVAGAISTVLGYVVAYLVPETRYSSG